MEEMLLDVFESLPLFGEPRDSLDHVKMTDFCDYRLDTFGYNVACVMTPSE
jgi:hypothetical protein